MLILMDCRVMMVLDDSVISVSSGAGDRVINPSNDPGQHLTAGPSPSQISVWRVSSQSEAVCGGVLGGPCWCCPSRKPLPLPSIDLVCWESPVHRPLLLQSQRLPETFLRSFQLDQLDFNGLKSTPVNSYFPPPLLGKWINERSKDTTIVYYIVI